VKLIFQARVPASHARARSARVPQHSTWHASSTSVSSARPARGSRGPTPRIWQSPAPQLHQGRPAAAPFAPGRSGSRAQGRLHLAGKGHAGAFGGGVARRPLLNSLPGVV
jgi:hypothetical protein